MSEYQNYKTRIKADNEKKTRGLGGWLILFQIYLFSSVLLALIPFIYSPYAYINTELLAVTLGILLLIIFCLVFFYNKSIHFRIFYISVTVLSIAYRVVLLIRNVERYWLFDDMTFSFIYYFVFSVLIIGGLFHLNE